VLCRFFFSNSIDNTYFSCEAVSYEKSIVSAAEKCKNLVPPHRPTYTNDAAVTLARREQGESRVSQATIVGDLPSIYSVCGPVPKPIQGLILASCCSIMTKSFALQWHTTFREYKKSTQLLTNVLQKRFVPIPTANYYLLD
jgi:hypothetical protein